MMACWSITFPRSPLRRQRSALCWSTIRCGFIGHEHDPEKWVPVFGKDHAQTKNALAPMHARAGALLVMAAILHGAVAASAQERANQEGAKPSWPALPTTGFISGRPATDKDVADGKAVFVLRAYGIAFGKPFDVTIPQYAYLTKRGQHAIPVIVVQAEQGKGIRIFGLRGLDGKTATARESELRLLGARPPD